jgi:triacylglycerol esterase/lipase EstA (alpha/beta hydrolase family)
MVPGVSGRTHPLVAAAVAALVAVLLPWGSIAAATAPPRAAVPPGTIVQGVLADLTDPGGTPPGMNDWTCHPSTTHPYPVILLHGTLFNENLTWQALSPELVDAGYCVYGFDYGTGPYSDQGVYGVADIAHSAIELARFVDYVRIATRARQVDIVGHSQGGMMPRYYMKFLGGAPSVHMLVGLAPSNHGTTLDGSDALLAVAHRLGIDAFTVAGCVACTEQINGQGSSFMATLNAGGDTVPGPDYVVIESMYDEVVTPYTSAFLKGPHVQNILLQAQCPTDFSEHIGIVYDPVALQDVLNALGPDDPGFQPTCSFVPPGIG